MAGQNPSTSAEVSAIGPTATLDGRPCVWPPRPTFASLGLTPALFEVLAVLAASDGKHPHSDWSARTVEHHAAKLEGHFERWQAGERIDGGIDGTGRRALAHVAARALMALGVELKGLDDGE